MTIDGFEPSDCEPGALSPEVADPFFDRVRRVAEWLSVEVDGIEHIPKGRALLVANHAFGWDIAFAMAAIRKATEREVFALGEHMWWKIPWLRGLAAGVGVVDGTQENVDRLLGSDQLVLVMPGGMREAIKPRALRYRLLWAQRYGFVRAAIRHRAPIVPIAAIGADEIFDLVGDAYARGRRWLGPIGLGWLPLPKPAYGVPWLHRAKLRYVIGEPIEPMFSPEQENDPHALRTMRLLTAGAIHELIDRELARRADVVTSSPKPR